MKLILFFVISCLTLHTGKGAPITAVYKFVRCNPEGDQANCVTQQSQPMAWSPDLPAKLPASAAQYLEAEPVEGESPLREEGEEEDVLEEETPMLGEEEESPMFFMPEEGSGGYEGSADDIMPMADRAFETAESETGSGGDRMDMRRLFPSRSLVGEAKPAEHELREDHLLQL